MRRRAWPPLLALLLAAQAVAGAGAFTVVDDAERAAGADHGLGAQQYGDLVRAGS